MRVVFAFDRMKIKIMRIKNLKKFQYPRHVKKIFMLKFFYENPGPSDDNSRHFIPDL